MRVRAYAAATAALVLVLGVLAAARSDEDPFRKLPRPEGRGEAPTSTTAPPPLSNVGLAPVPGQTTTTIDQTPGKATLAGVVVGPDGGAGGATVRLERLVGDGMVRTDVVTAADGSWELANIKGGRYRVRAFRVPDLAQARSEVILLGGDETRRLDLRVDSYGGVTTTRAIAPNPPLVGQPANLVVRVVRREVDEDGRVRTEALAGVSVELFGSGSWGLASPNPSFTGETGNATFRLTCRAVGSNPLSALIEGSETVPLDLPACERPAPSTTTTTTSTTTTTTTEGTGTSTSTTSTSTTTTGSPTSTSRTTSTTAAPDLDPEA